MADTYYEKKQDEQRRKITDKMELLPVYAQGFIKGKAQSLEPSTRLVYMDDLQIFFSWLLKASKWTEFTQKTLPIEAVAYLTPEDIEEFLDYLSVYKTESGEIRRNSAKAKLRKLATLRAFYNFLIKRRYEYVTQDGVETRFMLNPAALADKPKAHKKEIITLSKSSQNSILNTVIEGTNLSGKMAQIHGKYQYRDTAILYILLGTGIRVSELVGLNIDDVNISIKSLTVTRKGGNTDYVYFNDEVAGALLDYLTLERDTYKPNEESEKALFLSRQHSRINVRSVENLVKKYANAALGAGNKISPHKMRSTFATNAVNEFGDIWAVSQAMGHSSINTTSRYYTKGSDEAKKKVSNIKIEK